MQMTDEEKAFVESCDEFKDYKSIDEYIADIRRLLMIGIINRRYSEKEADELIHDDIHMKWIEESFSEKEDACLAAVDIAYCCG